MGFYVKNDFEEDLDRYAKIKPSVLQAIEKNRPAFMALMLSILEETANDLIVVTTLSPEEAENNANLKGETADTAVNEQILQTVKSMVMANYMVAFLSEEVSFSSAVLHNAVVHGMKDGHAYLRVKTMPRH